MSLVGLIEAGSVDRILHSVSFAAGDVLVLLSQESASGHVLFEKGQIVTARLGELRDEAAIAALRQWSSGHYTLIKRGQAGEGSRGHVALGLPNRLARRTLGKWLESRGYQTSVLANPQQAIESIVFLQPDLLLVDCPRPTMGLTCAELTARLQQEMRLAPAIMVLESAESACREPGPRCVRGHATVEDLDRLIASLDWTGTRLGVRLASQEETGKIPRPRPRAQPAPSTETEDVLARVVEDSLRQKGRLTWRDLLLAAVVLVAGSSLVWLALWP